MLLLSSERLCSLSLKSDPGDWAALHRDAYLREYFVAKRALGAKASRAFIIQVGGEYQYETQVTFEVSLDGTLAVVEYLTLEGGNLTAQLTALRAAAPAASEKQIFARVKTLRGKLDSKARPGLLSIAKDFDVITIRPVPDDLLTLPGALYTLTVQGTSGSYIFDFHWSIPSDRPGSSSSWGRENGGNRQLVDWARRVLAEIGVETDEHLRAGTADRRPPAGDPRGGDGSKR
jgi:hypothetical protein